MSAEQGQLLVRPGFTISPEALEAHVAERVRLACARVRESCAREAERRGAKVTASAIRRVRCP